MTRDELAALDERATPGVWETDSEYDDDALYSGGGGCGSGFKNYFIGTDVGGKWVTLLDTVNSDHKLVEEEYDEDGKTAWDCIGQANTELIVTLVNLYRAGQLVLVPSVEDLLREARDAILSYSRDPDEAIAAKLTAILASMGAKTDGN